MIAEATDKNLTPNQKLFSEDFYELIIEFFQFSTSELEKSKKKNNNSKLPSIFQIYEFSTKIHPHSCKLWLSWMEAAIDNQESPENIRRIFSSAIKLVHERDAIKIWIKYLSYSFQQNLSFDQLMKLYQVRQLYNFSKKKKLIPQSGNYFHFLWFN